MSNPISPTLARWYDWLAGFRGSALDTAVAIEQAESSLVPSAWNTAGNSAGKDRGIWEINNAYHPEVSDAQAYDPLLASQSAFAIYQASGNSFRQWSTFVSGAYKKFLGNVGNISNFMPQWYQYKTSQSYGQNGETGVDVATPFHTPLTALYGGTVIDAGYHPYGGQVEIQTNVPGWGNVVETFIHLDSIAPNIVPGAHVDAGGVLGLTGGENPGYPGALHPADPKYSSGPHVEIDFERNGKNLNPVGVISAFRGDNITAMQTPGGPTLSSPTQGAPSLDCSQYPFLSPQWIACQSANIGSAGGTAIAGAQGGIGQAISAILSSLVGYFERGALIAAGSVLIIIGLLVLFFDHGGKEVIQGVTDAAVAS